MKAGHRLFNRQQILVSPEALGPARDRLARNFALHLRVVVIHLVRPEALLTNMHRRHRHAVAALFAFESENEVHRVHQKRKASSHKKRLWRADSRRASSYLSRART